MSKQELKWEKFAFAGIGCVVAGAATNPVDVAKIRLQMQNQRLAESASEVSVASNTAAVPKYRGLLHGVGVIQREEGWRGLTRGMGATVLREGSYSSLRIGLYDPVKALFVSEGEEVHGLEMPLWKKIAAGGMGGGLAGALANPFDLIKVRQQVEGKPVYSSVMHGLSTVSREEGVARLWRGSSPTIQRAILVTATQLPSYDQCKHLLLHTGVIDEGWGLHFIASMFAGVMTALTTSPVDLVKTRVMTQPVDANGRGLLYSGTLDCAWKVARSEGVLGLYAGFNAQWLRIGPHTVISLMVVEQLRMMFGIETV